MDYEEDFRRRAQQIDWVLSDVDGVLTDGSLYIEGRGERLKVFHVHDGLGLQMARQAGLGVGLLSARSSPALDRRASELGVDVVSSGREDKLAAFEEFLRRQQTTAARVAYVGDDLNDLAVLGRCGLSFAPADAAAEVLDLVKVRLKRRGGHGAVREMIEHLLKARGEWPRVLSGFSLER